MPSDIIADRMSSAESVADALSTAMVHDRPRLRNHSQRHHDVS